MTTTTVSPQLAILSEALSGWHASDRASVAKRERARTYRWRASVEARTPAEAFAILVEDIEWLLDSGESAAAIADRLGRPQKNLARSLWRCGRHDLAGRMDEWTPR